MLNLSGTKTRKWNISLRNKTGNRRKITENDYNTEKFYTKTRNTEKLNQNAEK